MNPLAIAAGILITVISLMLIGNISTWFIEAQQVQIIYLGIAVFAVMVLVGTFHKG